MTEMTDLPELKRLKDLLAELIQIPDNQNTLLFVAARHGSRIEEPDATTAFYKLHGDIISLEQAVQENFKEQGRKKVALQALTGVRALLSLQTLSTPSQQYRGQNSASLGRCLDLLELVSDITYNVAETVSSNAAIIAEIERIRGKCAAATDLSEASRAVLDAQLKLLERSVVSIERIGVSGFRDSIFTIVGRVVIQLENDKENKPEVVRETVDDVLRLVGLAQAGGSILKLGAPIIAGFLMAPK